MKYFITILFATFWLCTSLSGCSIFAKPIVKQVSKVVVTYCKEPLNQRMVYRQQINDKLALYGHVVHAHCSGDPGEVVRND